MGTSRCITPLIVAGLAGTVFGQGSLAPAGPPAPIMKTLEEVEPRAAISGATVITTPGSYYLSAPITNGNIIVTASDVVLDLNGFSIEGSGAGFGLALSNGENVEVRNGTLRGFGSGINCSYSRNCRMINLAIVECATNGVHFRGPGALCTGNRIEQCRITNNGENGIFFGVDAAGGCTDNAVVGCVIDRNGANGISLQGVNGVSCNGNQIAQCTIVDNTGHGIHLNGLNGECSNNRVEDCVVRSNQGAGVRVEGTANRIHRCTLSENRESGLHLIGATSAPASENAVLDCDIRDNRAYGIYCESSSPAGCQHNVIRDCRISDNGEAGLLMQGFCNGNQVVANTIVNNQGSEAGLRVLGKNNRIAGNTVRGHPDNYEFSDDNQLDLLICEVPESIDWSAHAQLAGSFLSSGHGISITTNNVTLDLMGFTLHGDRDSGDYGIHVSGSAALSGIVVRNGVVQDFDVGVLLDSASQTTLVALRVIDNATEGIYLTPSGSGPCNGNRIVDCTLAENGNRGVHFNATSGACNGNRIQHCVMQHNLRGIELGGSFGSGSYNGNRIADCVIEGNSHEGIKMEIGIAGECVGNVIEDCAITGNGSEGIGLNSLGSENSGNVIRNCTLRANDIYGIYAVGTKACRIEGNHVSGTQGASTFGIKTSAGQDNLVTGNSCVGHTTNYDIDVTDTYGEIVTGTGSLSGTDPWANFSL